MSCGRGTWLPGAVESAATRFPVYLAKAEFEAATLCVALKEASRAGAADRFRYPWVSTLLAPSASFPLIHSKSISQNYS